MNVVHHLPARQKQPPPAAESPMVEPLPNDMAALQAKIAGVLAVKPQCSITHPSELHALKGMTPEEVRAFAGKHGWRSVRRVGGRQVEFYKDATVESNLAEG